MAETKVFPWSGHIDIDAGKVPLCMSAGWNAVRFKPFMHSGKYATKQVPCRECDMTCPSALKQSASYLLIENL